MNNELSKTIGNRINTLLAQKKVKQKDLAAELGVTDNTISYFCKGSRMPNTEQILKISDFFGVSADYLLGRTGAETKDRDLRFVCDYLGFEEKTVNNISIKDRFVFPSAQRSHSFYSNLGQFFVFFEGEYSEIYNKSVNKFLQSGCMFDIIIACVYEQVLEHCFNQIVSYEKSEIKLSELSDCELNKLKVCINIFSEYYDHHMLNLFTAQNSVLDFIKSITLYGNSPEQTEESLKEYSSVLWIMNEEIQELEERDNNAHNPETQE